MHGSHQIWGLLALCLCALTLGRPKDAMGLVCLGMGVPSVLLPLVGLGRGCETASVGALVGYSAVPCGERLCFNF